MRGSMVSPGRLPRRLATVVSMLLCLLPAAGGAREPGTMVRVRSGTVFVFADVALGRRVMARRDAFVDAMSPLDRSLRLMRDHATGEEDLLAFYGSAARAWTPGPQRALASAVGELEPALGTLAPLLPDRVILVRTSAAVDSGMAHTRGNAIVLPEGSLPPRAVEQRRLLVHELFHIVTRYHPGLRDDLYAAVGFEPCSELVLPEGLAARIVTNPDALELRHFVRVRRQATELLLVPVIDSRSARWDERIGGSLADYIVPGLLRIEVSGGRCAPMLRGGRLLVYSFRDVPEVLPATGGNTGYLWHPEEIAAANLELSLGDPGALASPELPGRLVGVLADAATRTPQHPAARGN